jgi:molecular chaperone GrpE
VEVEVEPPAPAVVAPAPAKRTPQDAIIEALIKGKQEAQEALKQTQKEAKDLLDGKVRVQAEFENFRKRVQKDKADTQQFATQGLARDLLPVMDNFERALAHADPSKGTEELTTVLQGIRMVQRQLTDILKKAGVEGFVSQGQPFDPHRHEAVAQVPATGEVQPGTVVEEHQRGYMHHDRLLRPALVVVAGPREGGST